MADNDRYDLIIVGGGAMGLSSAFHAARRGLSVLVLEQWAFYNQKGSTAGASRQFRLQYSQPYMSELAVQAVPEWRLLQTFSPHTLVGDRGSLWLGEGAQATQEGGVGEAIETMDALGIPYQPLTARMIEQRFPFTNLPDSYIGFFQPDGGMINVPATLQALCVTAQVHPKVTLRDHTKVCGIETALSGVTVHTEGGTYAADKLIVTPGPYANDVLRHIGVRVGVDIWEMASAYFKMNDPRLADTPTWFAFQAPLPTDTGEANSNLFYGFPEASWSHPGYLRVAPDFPGKILADPSQRDGVPSQRDLDLTAKWVREHMRGLDPDPQFASTCLIGLSLNGNKELLLDFAPPSVTGNRNVVIYTAGWAAKFIPLIGKICVQLAFDGETPYNISNFALGASVPQLAPDVG